MASRGSLSLEHLREASLSYILYAGLWHPETEKKILPVSLDLDPGDTCSLRDSMRRKNRGERRQPLPLSSFFPLCVSRSPTSSSSSSYRAIDFVLASSGARENWRESIFFFRFDLERNVDSNVDRESLSSCARLYLRASRAEPSSLSSPACHGKRKKKSVRFTSTIHQGYFERGCYANRSSSRLESCIQKGSNRRGSCIWKFNSIDPRLLTIRARIIGITELSWIYRGPVVARLRDLELEET